MNRDETGELKRAMGSWLSGLAPWDVYATWTFSEPVKVAGAMYWARRHLDHVRSMARAEPFAFVAVEHGHNGGLLHLHALVGNVGHLPASCDRLLPQDSWGLNCCLRHAWPCGYARVLPYDPQQGASYYVSKYCTRELSEWDLLGFPAAITSCEPNATPARPPSRREVPLTTNSTLRSPRPSTKLIRLPLDSAIERVRRSEVRRR
jgi:hypothetical protein